MKKVEKKYFLSEDSKLDGDSSDFAVSKNSWMNMQNCRTGSTDNGSIGGVEAIGSTLQLSTTLPSVTWMRIGNAEDTENSRFCTFYYNVHGPWHKIECTYSDTDTTYTVLLSEDVTGGLNFNKDFPIHSARIQNGNLFWVEGTNNQPRQVNIESGIKAYHPSFDTDEPPYAFPLSFSQITIIKPPPIFTPNINKVTDTSYTNNFISNDSFQFSFQYQYYGDEITVPSEYSQASRLNFVTDTYNKIEVEMDTRESVPSTVRIVRLVVRIGNGEDGGSNNAIVVKTWDREISDENDEIEDQNSGTQVLSFDFYNNNTGEFLAKDDVIRPFDNVPIYSEGLELAKSKLFLANNTEGYDTPEAVSLSVSLVNPIVLAASTFAGTVRLVTHGGAISALSFYQYKGYYLYIPWLSPAGYYLIGSLETLTLSPTTPTPADPPSTIAFSGLTFKGSTLSDVVNTTKPSGYTNSYISDVFTLFLIQITGVSTSTWNILTQLATYKVGVVFYDFAMRKCGVVDKVTDDTFVTVASYSSILVEGISANQIKLVDSIYLFINPEDKIVIAGGALAGTYTVVSVSNYIITVVEAVGVVAPYLSTTFTITRLSSLQITTPVRNFEYSTAFTGIGWELSPSSPVTEIPDWAYYYEVVRTLNLRTRGFIQAYTNAAKYATKDSEGAYVFTSDTYVTQSVGIALNTDALNQVGLGYVYTQGDMCILIKEGTTTYYTLPVVGQYGNYIIIKAEDIGSLAGIEFVYEVYTPYKPSEQEPYYGMGEVYRILEPGTVNRNYEITQGIFNPDSYALTRNFNAITYIAGAMCPNDLFFQRWDNDGGKPSFITKLGQQQKINSISWSDTIIQNTSVNGLCTFRALNQKQVPENCGAIRKIILTSKVSNEGQGQVMLSICEVETNSMYLGETQVTDSTGATQFFSASLEVISTINTLKGSYGTMNPESVVEFRGRVFWADAKNGLWIQYAENGMFPISDINLSVFWKQFFALYVSMTMAEIEALGSRPFLFSCVDASHMELLIAIPKLLSIPPKGYLPDYPSTIYPFDVWDGTAKCMVYCLEQRGMRPRWQGSFPYTAEGFITILNKLYSFKNGQMYLHNQTTLPYANIYGTQYTAKIMAVCNELPQSPKTYNNIAIESNIVPTLVYFYNNYPEQQASDLVDFDFQNREGVFCANIYRNKLIPTQSGYTTDGLLTGQKMRNVAMKVMIEFTVTTSQLQLKFVDVEYDISLGHSTINT